MKLNTKHFLLFTSITVASSMMITYYINSLNKPINRNISSNQVNISKPDEIITMTISVTGDIITHTPQLKAQINNSTNTYSFIDNFEKVKPIFDSTDLALTNLETTLPGKDYSGYPMFSTPDALAEALKFSGFDVISLVNNHSADKGPLGLTRTLDIIREQGMDTIGIKKDLSEKNYLIKEVSGFKLGLFAYSYGDIKDGREYLNGNPIPKELTDLVNVFDPKDVNAAMNLMKKDIDMIKSEGVDSIILFIHWGEEYKREPNQFQKELAQRLCDEGVDVIIGSHPHVVQPIEFLNSNNPSAPKESLVIYSLGNALSNQRREYTNSMYTEDGLIPIITLEKNITKNRTYIKGVEYIPTWVEKSYNNSLGKFSYVIYPITKDSQSNKKLEQSYLNTTSLIGETDKIKAK